jgi:hypothetical protein
MDVNDLLSRLSKVRRTGQGTWVACCPAHQDRTPSMTIKETPDGVILMHDFGGCGTDAILAVLGLEMGDLFPEPLGHHFPSRRQFSASDALRCLARESSIVAMAAADQSEGKPVDTDRAAIAAGRIAEALEMTCGN